MPPRWPKLAPRRSQDSPWGLSWCSLGLSRGSLGRRWPPKTLKNKWFFKVFANSGFWYLQALDGRFGLILAPPWAVLGLSWAVLGLSWGCLGVSWGVLGLSWGCLGLSWGCHGLSWACVSVCCSLSIMPAMPSLCTGSQSSQPYFDGRLDLLNLAYS